MNSRIEIIEHTLRDNLNIHTLITEDQGHLHQGHQPAKEGKMHLKISIVSNDFADMSPIKRHQKEMEKMKAEWQQKLADALKAKDREILELCESSKTDTVASQIVNVFPLLVNIFCQ